MTLLLDTHILLWWLAADPRLPRRAQSAVADRRNTAVMSAAAVWEVAIKVALGRLEFADDLPAVAAQEGFEVLAISAAHAWAAGALPPHHTDPFDRMLVAQAHAHRLTLVSVDPAFRDYDVNLLAL